MVSSGIPLYNRDLSWLSFNYRVLTMARDERVPLFERVRFLSIFSSNLDEFFRVRMPAIIAVNRLLDRDASAAGDETLTRDTLTQVQLEINRHLQEFGTILTTLLLPALHSRKLHLYYNETIHRQHHAFIREYFLTRVLAYLQPVWLQSPGAKSVFLENNALYLVVCMQAADDAHTLLHAVVNIPSTQLPRFITLPSEDDITYVALLDDIIKEHLSFVFPGYTITGSYGIKITRDGEADMDELKGDVLEQVETMIAKRELGIPTRFLFDATMPLPVQQWLANYFEVLPAEMVQGGRYHNLKDLADLPMPASTAGMNYPPMPAARLGTLEDAPRILDLILERDILLHVPYQRYDYILRFFNEAAIDPDVAEIYVTLYRIAAGSQIANALISAAKNGKQVTVFVELKARFDEANNIRWSKKMKAAGVRIVYSIPGLKVHAKIALVKRKRGYVYDYLSLMATGNFNESTARFYTDHVLLTSHTGITREMELLFIYLQTREQPLEYQFLRFEHLLVAQFNLMDRFCALIDREIAHARAGRPARIVIKLNNLQERAMIAKLYEASEAGVEIDLIVRSICCLQPGQPVSKNIRVRRIVDRFLEHARVFVFHNNGVPETFMGSADWMNRNLHRRIEVCFPIYDAALAEQVNRIIALQLADNTNAVMLDAQLENVPVAAAPGSVQVNAQRDIHHYVSQLS